ncbi:MAG: DUF3850 domain-containing protein [Bacteroidales bacterium]
MDTIHKLKLQQPFFDDVLYGRKTFEVRKDNRGFEVGDVVVLMEYEGDKPLQGSIKMLITYILPGGQHGIEKGYVVLGLSKMDTGESITLSKPAIKEFNVSKVML